MIKLKLRSILAGIITFPGRDRTAWDQIKEAGDVVKVDNGAIINFANAIGEAEYAKGRFSTYHSGSIYNNWIQREDRYNYVEDIKSEVVSMSGYDVKAGANYNLNEFHNIYFNMGYFSILLSGFS
ncbi:MAG: hypothetical protein U5Q03_02490 [Bacteroidota bacterium]|nr:hypothetical protein [Bacteroidota bacterium]